jgi:hypothetical protein
VDSREFPVAADPDQSVPLAWRKSTFSEAGGCVEVADNRPSVLVKDSKNHSGPTLEFSIQAWCKFLTRMGLQER